MMRPSAKSPARYPQFGVAPNWSRPVAASTLISVPALARRNRSSQSRTNTKPPTRVTFHRIQTETITGA